MLRKIQNLGAEVVKTIVLKDAEQVVEEDVPTIVLTRVVNLAGMLVVEDVKIAIMSITKISKLWKKKTIFSHVVNSSKRLPKVYCLFLR